MMLPNAKADYQKKTETRLKKIRTQISTLEKKAGSAEADIEVRYDQKMDQIRGQYAQVKSKLEEMGKASQADWVDLKTELDRAIDILSEAVDNMARQISV
jgi:DNA repair exonuclease SbcCD ATPase subunit